MDFNNIKSFKEYLEDKRLLEAEIKSGQEEQEDKIEAPSDDTLKKRNNAGFMYSKGFSTTAEGNTSDEKIKSLSMKVNALIGTVNTLMLVFKGSASFKEVTEFDESVTAVKLLSTSMKQIEDNYIDKANIKSRVNAVNKDTETIEKNTKFFKGFKQRKIDRTQVEENFIDSAELNESFFNRLKFTNEIVNGKDKYNASRVVSSKKGEKLIMSSDPAERERFLSKIREEYFSRANIVFERNKRSIITPLKEARKKLDYWLNNQKYIRISESSYITMVTNLLVEAYGKLKYVAATLNTILGDYREVARSIHAKISEKNFDNKETLSSHNYKVAQEKNERRDAALEKASDVIKQGAEKASDVIKQGAEKVTDAVKSKAGELRDKYEATKLRDKEIKETRLAAAQEAREALKLGKVDSMAKSSVDIIDSFRENGDEEALKLINTALVNELNRLIAKRKEYESEKNVSMSAPTSDAAEIETNRDRKAETQQRNVAGSNNAVKFAKDFEAEDEPKNIFDYAIKKAKSLR